jgi:hypothetical protein
MLRFGSLLVTTTTIQHITHRTLASKFCLDWLLILSIRRFFGIAAVVTSPLPYELKVKVLTKIEGGPHTFLQDFRVVPGSWRRRHVEV